MDPEALVEAFVEGAQDGLWVLDLEGRTVYANRAMSRMYGGDADGEPPETGFAILDDAGREQFAALLAATRAGTYHGGESQETLFHDRDGHASWVLISDTLLRDDEGRVAGLVVRLSDFAETRRTRDALDRSRADLEEARAIGKLGSWRLDVATGVVSVPTPVGSVAPDGGEEVRTTLPEFLAGVHPHDREHAAAVVRDAVEHGDGFEFDVRVPRPEGWAWIRGRGVVHRDAAGVATSVTGTHQDVSETKAAERALQVETQRAELVGRAAAAANEAGSFAEALAATRDLAAQHVLAHRVSGWTAVDGGLEHVVGDVGPGHEALAREAHGTGEPAWHDDDHLVAVPTVRLGTSYGVLVFESVEPLDRATTGASAATLSAHLGLVAARERTLRELVDARDAATAAAREKTEFLATMSHEIRTPLNGILGLTDLVLRTRLDADQLRYVSGVQVASRDLLRVVNDVLDFSTIQAGGLEIQQEDFEPREVLDAVGELVAPQAAEAEVELVLSCHPDVPARLTGDPARISQVLVNLVSNAVRFAPGQEVFVHVTRDDDRPAAPHHVAVQASVRDTGVGIEPGRVGAMFAPFTQADTSHRRRHGGAGLGLAIARGIAQALGGDLRHAPTPGGGSTFTLQATFPVPPPVPGGLDDYARTWLADRRLLVVDARPQQRTRLEEATRWWGMRTVAVATAGEARAELADARRAGDPVAAVVVDLDDDGAGLALARDVGPDGPAVLALTSRPEVDLTEVRAAGVSVCLPLPVTTAVLRGTLLEQLAGVPARPVDPDGGPGHRPAARRRVLVVEDNPVNQMVATGLLQSLGYDADVADDGEAGLAALAQAPYDAVLMDVQMPVLDGYDTTRALRERGLRLPVIALTAASVEGERQRCLEAGMDDFLTKPVDPRALGEALRHWLGDAEPEPDEPEPDEPQPLHPPTPPVAGLDVERLDMLRDLDPPDTTYLDRAIANFERNSVEAVTSMRELAAAGDAAGLKAVAHKIAGSALNLGVADGGTAARRLELAVEAGPLADALPLLDRVDELFTEGRRLLAAYQASYSA